jgi:hypothetical protein
LEQTLYPWAEVNSPGMRLNLYDGLMKIHS